MNLTDENIAYPKISAKSNPEILPDRIVSIFTNNRIAKITVNPPIMIGANQYAHAAFFLYPDHTARKKAPGIRLDYRTENRRRM